MAYTLRRTSNPSEYAFVVMEPNQAPTPEYAADLTAIHTWLSDQLGALGDRWTMSASTEARYATIIHFTHRRDAAAFRLRWQ